MSKNCPATWSLQRIVPPLTVFFAEPLLKAGRSTFTLRVCLNLCVTRYLHASSLSLWQNSGLRVKHKACNLLTLYVNGSDEQRVGGRNWFPAGFSLFVPGCLRKTLRYYPLAMSLDL